MTRNKVQFAVVVVGLLALFALCVVGVSLADQGPLPVEPGLYHAAEGKYSRLPDCSGKECEGCVPSMWIEAAKAKPIDSRSLVLVMRSLLSPPNDGKHNSDNASPQFVATVVTLRIDTAKLSVVDSDLKVSDSKQEVITISFKEEIAPGVYALLQGFPNADRYGSIKSATGSLCFIAFDADSNIVGAARPLGVFVAR